MTTRTFTVRVSDSEGNETVGTKTFGVGDAVTPIAGDFSGIIGQGEHAHIIGNVNLTGDLIVEGFLTGVDTFTLEGNGHQILVQHGGQVNLQGTVKTGWTGWGGRRLTSDPVVPVVGWNVADRIGIAPTNSFLPSLTTWSGNWGTRPPASPTLLPGGQSIEPEVANLTRSITLKNLSRFHFHDDPGVQILKHLAVVNSGITGVLAQYPIHFHLCGESVRGSLIEGVVVEGGKNHAFVVHGSHGVTLRDCVAYNTIQDAYWWDLPSGPEHTVNNSNDTIYEHVLGMWVKSVAVDHSLSAFLLGAGSGNSVVDSVMCAVNGGTSGSGFHWPSQANQNAGGNVWVFERNVAHHNKELGIFVWQNDGNPHVVKDFIGYKNRTTQISHGAYTNNYDYLNLVLSGGLNYSFELHSRGFVLVEDVIADKPLRIQKHTFPPNSFIVFRRCDFPSVVYGELQGQSPEPSWIRFEDCGYTPADFTFLPGSAIHPQSLIETTEAGMLTHRWAGGWT